MAHLELSLTKQEKIWLLFKMIKEVTWTVVGVFVIIAVTAVLPLEHYANITAKQLLSCTVEVDGSVRGNPACIQSQILAITGSTRATMGAIAKAAPSITEAVRAASANSVEASKATTETAQQATRLLASAAASTDELQATIKELHAQILDLSVSAGVLLGSSNKTVRDAGLTIAALGTITNELQAEIAQKSPYVSESLLAMNRLLNDPSIKETLGHIDATSENIEAGTKSAANTVETLDIATRDLRKKMGRVKFILSKIAGMVKLTLPIF